MKDKLLGVAVLFGVLLVVCVLHDPSTCYDTRGLSMAHSTSLQATRIGFIANRGQFAENILYLMSFSRGTASLTAAGELVFSINPGLAAEDKSPVFLTETMINHLPLTVRGTSQTSTTCNWFRGADSSTWRSNVPTFATVGLGEAYPGVTASIVAAGPTVEKVFVVQPGGKPQAIRLRISGADSINILSTGELCAYTPAVQVQFSKPVAYQDIAGHRDYVEVCYAVAGNTYGFQFGDYDPSSPLTIDPMVAFTYYGGNFPDGVEYSPGTVDKDGNVILIGTTESVELPMPTGAYCNEYAGNEDAFIAKFSPDLERLLAATYLGGSGHDRGRFVKAAGDGNIFVCGSTTSTNFPTTPGAYDRSYAGGCDGFLAVLTGDLNQLLASTYFGGSNEDDFLSLTSDGQGSVFLQGYTSSLLPTFSNAFDHDPWVGGVFDLYVAKFSSDLSRLIVGTYLGGNDGAEYALDMDIGPDGNLYLVGASTSSDFPTTPGAYDRVCPGTQQGMDGFISCLKPNLDTLLASTYIGGDGAEFSYGLAFDGDGDIYITGHVGETWPTTPGAYDRIYNDTGMYHDVGVAHLTHNLTGLIAATYIGGSDWDHGVGVMLDDSGRVWITGQTESPDFPTTPDADDPSHNGERDIFIAGLDPALATLEMSTFLGGSGFDDGKIVWFGESNSAYMIGTTYSPDFPGISGGYDPSYDGAGDAFVAILCLNSDCDGDGVLNVNDNCAITPNADQSDGDGDGVGDVCDDCPATFNPEQEDINFNGIGDSCEIPETWYVQADGSGEAPTIQAAIDSTTHGDTVLIADGVYTGVGNCELDFRGRRGILLTSANGPQTTIIDPQGSSSMPRRAFTLAENEDAETIIAGLTVRGGYGGSFNGSASGGGMLCNESSPTVRNCVFADNGAVAGGAVYSFAASPKFINCTFCDNSASLGSAVFSYNQSSVTLENCIIAFHPQGVPVSCYEGSSASATCTDIYGNAAGNWVAGLAGQGGINGNFSADPLFCNTAAGDFSIDDNSPCTPENNECEILIGAQDIGCYCDCGVAGDMDCSRVTTPLDVSFLVKFVYLAQDALCPLPDCPYPVGDLDCNSQVTPLDVAYIVNAVYKAQDAMCDGCASSFNTKRKER